MCSNTDPWSSLMVLMVFYQSGSTEKNEPLSQVAWRERRKRIPASGFHANLSAKCRQMASIWGHFDQVDVDACAREAHACSPQLHERRQINTRPGQCSQMPNPQNKRPTFLPPTTFLQNSLLLQASFPVKLKAPSNTVVVPCLPRNVHVSLGDRTVQIRQLETN